MQNIFGTIFWNKMCKGYEQIPTDNNVSRRPVVDIGVLFQGPHLDFKSILTIEVPFIMSILHVIGYLNNTRKYDKFKC